MLPLEAAKQLREGKLSFWDALGPEGLPGALSELFAYLVLRRFSPYVPVDEAGKQRFVDDFTWLNHAGGASLDAPCLWGAGHKNQWLRRRIFWRESYECTLCWKVAEQGKGRFSVCIGYRHEEQRNSESQNYLHIGYITTIRQTTRSGRNLPESLARLSELWDFCGAERTPFLALEGALPVEDVSGLW